MVNRWSIQTRYLVLIIILLLVAMLLYYARPLFSPLIVAALLAYVLDPAVGLLVRKIGMPRKAAVPLVYVIFMLVLAGIPAITAPVVLAQIDEIRIEINSLREGLDDLIAQARLWGLPLLPASTQGDTQDFFTLLYDPQRVFGVLLAATENIAWILITMVTTFYFLLDGARLQKWFINLAPDPYKVDLFRLQTQVKSIWQAYLRGQLLLMFTIGALTWLMAMAVGLRGALLIGLIAGALDVIPSLGPAVAMIIAAITAYVEGSTILPMSRLWFTLLVVGLFLGIQAFENVWLRPRVLSHSLRLHPAVVFVAIVGALALAGVVAALIVVPLISSGEVVGRYIFRRIWGLDPWPDYHDTEETAESEGVEEATQALPPGVPTPYADKGALPTGDDKPVDLAS
jgi:predicted PurR-regulated permease PerM